MRRIRRAKPRVAWMPTFGITTGSEIEANPPAAGIEFDLDIDDFEYGIVWDATGLTFDTSESAVVAQSEARHKTLQDIVSGNEWRLRRIVGKALLSAHCSVQGDSQATAADVALGFIVCKTYDDGEPLTDFEEVNPLAQESMEDPWIWRRRWILHPWGTSPYEANNSLASTADSRNTLAFAGYPAVTAGYGSVMDGPHIDAKSNRVIHRSERLFVVLAARAHPRLGSDPGPHYGMKIRGLLDYRMVGSLRATKYGNRGNTSR